jgi:glycosyltransferase involved in cell wall biosynthesis
MKPSVAVVRGKFLNRYEMQFFEPLVSEFCITAFGSLTPFHETFAFPTVKLPSPMDIPEFPYKMPLLNRMFVDAHYLLGLESRLKGFDLVHTAETYYRYTQQCLEAKRRGYVRKVIATVLENIPHNNEDIWGRRAFKQRARQELDHIIALTQKTKNALLVEGADPEKITVLPHFIDTKRFAPSVSTQKRRVTDRSELTILFVGRLELYKGVMDILEAAQLLLQDKELQEKKLTFLFVGDGSQKKYMMKKVHALQLESSVRFATSSYQDMPNVYQQADIFVAPSKSTPTWEEQYCTALLEAQAAGLPIVTTRSGGIPENIADAGVLIQPGDIGAIADTLKELILSQKKRNAYMLKAVQRAKKVHDMTIGSKQLSRLYHSVLDI